MFIDVMVDLFGGMSIEVKYCIVCVKVFDVKSIGGVDMCIDCVVDLEVFNGDILKRKKLLWCKL